MDKIACSERIIIARMDATPLLRWFARMQALSVAHLLGDAPPDVVLDYLMTGDKSIRAAARAAARDAVWAMAAAWDAAWDAAWASAMDAARAAASASAWAAAWAAARASASDAAWADAWAAARASARADFAALVHEAFEDWL